MRRLVLAVSLMLAGGPVAVADTAPSTPTPAPMTEVPASVYSQPQGRPSGFWTSTRPAVGQRYRWRLLGIGAVFALGSTLLVRRVIKRANANRSRTAAPALAPPVSK